MATKTVAINDAAYTKLDTSTESAIDCQNTSSVGVRVVFAAAQPAVGETACYHLNPGQSVARNGHTGDMWALALSPASVNVTVGE